MAMFLDPTIDFAFKRVFGNQAYPEITMSFVNSLIKSIWEVPVKTVEFLDPVNQKETTELKHSIVDLRCTDQLKRQFIIEIQVKKQDCFSNRIQYYGAQAIARQLKVKQSFKAIMPVILISILDFDLLPHVEYINNYRLQHDVYHTRELDLVSYIFIELKKFTKAIAELQGIEDEWIYFIKYANDLQSIPKELAVNHEIEEAFELLKQGNLNDEELAAYDRSVNARRVEDDVLATAEAKGIAKGKEEGKAEGKAEAKIELARTLLAEKMSLEQVARLTDLPLSEIKKLV